MFSFNADIRHNVTCHNFNFNNHIFDYKSSFLLLLLLFFCFSIVSTKKRSEECHNCGSVEVKDSYNIVVANVNHLELSDINIV